MIHREPETGIIIGARLFRGIEREGPRVGLDTLFIASPDVTISEIREQKPVGLYFGAGRLTKININVLRHFVEDPEYMVTLESSNLNLIAAVLKDPTTEPSVLCILAKSRSTMQSTMRLCDATDASIDALAAMYPNQMGIKSENETQVTINFGTRRYVTPLNSDYAEDVVIS